MKSPFSAMSKENKRSIAWVIVIALLLLSAVGHYKSMKAFDRVIASSLEDIATACVQFSRSADSQGEALDYERASSSFFDRTIGDLYALNAAAESGFLYHRYRLHAFHIFLLRLPLADEPEQQQRYLEIIHQIAAEMDRARPLPSDYNCVLDPKKLADVVARVEALCAQD